MRSARAAALAAASVLLAGCGRRDGPPAPDPEMVALGRGVYHQYCAGCHGANGEGTADWDTPNVAGELPAPPHDSTGHTWKHSDRMLYHIVLQGWRDPFNKTERLTMPAFQGVLSPAEARAVITYLKTLWSAEQRRFQAQESQDESFPTVPADAGASMKDKEVGL